MFATPPLIFRSFAKDQLLQARKLTGWLLTLLALGIAAAACGSSGDPTSTPVATATTVVQPTETPAATAIPNGVAPDLAEFLAQVDARMAEIRGIPVAEPVPYRFLNQQDLNDYVRAQLDEPDTIEEIFNAGGLYKLLGLISPESVLFDQYAALLDSQVLGAYDPEDEEFVVLQRGDGFGPSQEFTYAHEYIHRLQDARFSLDAITDRLETDSDRSLAFTALVEGDATTAQQAYALRFLDFTQLGQILAEASGSVAASENAPFILRRQLEFPYIEGARFVESLRGERGLEGIDDAFENPPDSTEQIIHFEKFISREAPVEVTIAAGVFSESGPAGEGWEVLDEDSLGEFFLTAWLQGIGAAGSDAVAAAAGWGGDTMQLAQHESGDYAFVAKIAWDSPASDANEFFRVLTGVMEASDEFQTVSVGPVDLGIRAFQGPGGVIVISTLSGGTQGDATGVAAAPTLQMAMPLMLALAG